MPTERAKLTAFPDVARDALVALATPTPTVGPPVYAVEGPVLGDEADALLDGILRRDGDLVDNDPRRLGYRRGRALPDVPELTDVVATRVVERLPRWAEAFSLDIGDANATTVLELCDLAITAYGDGDFLGPHRDDGHGSIPNGRLLSFVYWLHRRPRPFRGGALRLCGWVEHDGALVPGPPAVDLEPAHDHLVVFFSSTMHEVFPVEAPPDPAAGRFTVTGFVRRR